MLPKKWVLKEWAVINWETRFKEQAEHFTQRKIHVEKAEFLIRHLRNVGWLGRGVARKPEESYMYWYFGDWSRSNKKSRGSQVEKWHN
jgi:hypothetical protein